MSFNKSNYAPLTTGYAGDVPSYRSAYVSTTDSLAQIMVSGYFNTIGDILTIGDLLLIKASDDTQIIQVTGIAPVTTILFTGITRYAEVAISSAEILALRATPKTLVAAPGTGRVLQFISGLLLLDYNSVGYTESTDNMAVKFTDGSGVAVSQTIEATGFIDQTADTLTSMLAKIDAIAAKTGSENKALVLHNTGDGEYAAGNSPMRAKVAYQIHYTGW